jgi:hypothetical protein
VPEESKKSDKPKKEKGKKTPDNPLPPSPPKKSENKEKELLVASISKIHSFEGSYRETKRSIENLEIEIHALNDACQQLQTKLQIISKQDAENVYLSKERIKQIEDYKLKIASQVVTLKNSLQAAINDLDYKDEAKLSVNEKMLAAIKTQIAELRLNQDNLMAEMEAQSSFLDHILPKKTPKELAAEAVRLKKEKEKAEKEKKIEEENLKKAAAAKVARPKPPTRPLPLVKAPLPASVPAAKTEYKRPVTITQTPGEEKTTPRIQHLNQSSKNLLWIHKMLEMYLTELPAVIVHYALLYNIFRCFQSLRMYQECGGNSEAINSDEVINLRNMIMHHGASVTNYKEVIKFATEIKGKLSRVLAEMKGKNAYLISYELSYEDRQGLLEFSGFVSHNNLMIEETALYKKLQRFHDSKEHNNDSADIFELVCGKCIPMMRDILAKLNKENPVGVTINKELFIENYLFDLQALRMLATICGEFLGHFKDYSWITSIYSFLKNCRIEVRNSVAHNKEDNFHPVDFYTGLNAALAKVDEKRFLAMVKGSSKASVATSYATLFQPANSIGSATDIKYDRPTLK